MDLTAVPILMEHLKEAEKLTSEALRIADYGCSEGYNSMVIFRKVLEDFRSHSNRPLSILHTDLPDNNWSCFFNTVNNSENSYHWLENVFYYAVGKSFYRQLSPPNSIHVAFSAFAMHYLSKIPDRGQQEVGISYPEASEQAITDVTNNLMNRIKELVIGGFMTIIVAAKDEGNKKIVSMYFEPVKNLVAQGIVTAEEYQNYYWPSYHLSREEWERILGNFNGKIEVLSLEMTKGICPFYTEYINGGSEDEYREKLLSFVAVLVRNPLYNCLSSRSDEEKERIYQLCKNEIVKMIDNTEVCMYYSTVVIKKIAE
ncbi:hypothetical protein SteCoe_19962 [Stentor coeruleus]|uniref:SAM dependent carboxyl methyltransferase n=1 Tax=Stentor coeruleus TaxID=5963 RepID=A0A1R2BSY2_9CILI|nr:hypothetical protein SteCoe_19962 [Stentor coeruleus]